MKVVNKTDYSTRELKLIFHQVVRDLLKKRPSWREQWKRHGDDYRVKVGNRRQGRDVSGHAYTTLVPLWFDGGRRRPHLDPSK